MLPRQARDKHKENSNNRPFSHRSLSARSTSLLCSTELAWGSGCEKRHFLEPLIYKNRTFYQDRLGTNIGKALKKEWRCSQAIDYPFGDEEEWTALQQMQAL
jgi:hypothetical protein